MQVVLALLAAGGAAAVEWGNSTRVSSACNRAMVAYEKGKSTEAELARWSSASLDLLAQIAKSAVRGDDTESLIEFASGLHGTDLGDRDACASLDSYQYFLVSGPGPSFVFFPAFGLCLPKVCDVDDVHGLVADVTDGLPLEFRVRDDDFHYKTGLIGIAVIALCAVIACLVLAATAVETLGAIDPPESYAPLAGAASGTPNAEPEFGTKMLLCFSLVANYRDWTTRRGGAFACLDGVRVLSMLMVIFGHTLIWPFIGGPNFTNFGAIEPHDGKGLLARWTGQVIPSSEFSVDSFFWLSGFLGMYFMSKAATAAENAGVSPAKWIPMGILQRYLRLTPSYALVLVFWWKVARLAGKGALWSQERVLYRGCAEWWWTNLLYVNNLVPFNDPARCYGVAWYLGNDFQLFLLLPIFVLIRLRFGAVSTLLVVGSLCAASISFSTYLAVRYHLSFVPFDETDYQNDYYMRPWTRAPPHFIGVATAIVWSLLEKRTNPLSIFFVAKRNNPFEETSNAVRAPLFDARDARVLLVVALLIGGCCMFGSYPFYQDVPSEPALWKNHLYMVLSKPAWAISLGLIAVLAFAGQASIVATILELPLWAPLAKLTYLTYLIHPAILDLLYKSHMTSRITFSEVWYSVTFLGVATLTMTLAFVVHLFVEVPLLRLEKLILGKTKRASPNKPPINSSLTTQTTPATDLV